MARYIDNSGIENTCPKIDEVISAIESVEWSSDDKWNEKMLIDIMEEIRKANSDLRDWGNAMCRERDELHDDIKKYEYQVENLKLDVKDLKNEIDILSLAKEKFKSGTRFCYKESSDFKGVKSICVVDNDPIFKENANGVLVSTNYNFKYCFLNGIFKEIVS